MSFQKEQIIFRPASSKIFSDSHSSQSSSSGSSKIAQEPS